MKKIYLMILIPALVLPGSCEREKNPNGDTKGISIVPSGISTRSSEIGSKTLLTLPDGKDGIRMEETVTRLGGPLTRGEVVTTSTVGETYPNMTVSAYNGTTLIEGVKTFTYNSGKWAGAYDEDPWSSGAIDFFMLLGGGTPEGYDGTDFSFSYTSPGTAAAQNDLLFSSRGALSKDAYESEYNEHNGASALFCHALTGVNFTMTNESSTTYITSITIKGLYGTGTCSYTAGSETPTWTTSGSMGSFSESTTPTGEIFWFIPQAITSDLLLDITFTTDGGASTQTKTDLPFGETLLAGQTNLFWGAGELRTYSLTLDQSDVIIIFDHSENLEYHLAGPSWQWNTIPNNGTVYYLYNGSFYPIETGGKNKNFRWVRFYDGNNNHYINTSGDVVTNDYEGSETRTYNVPLYNTATNLSTVKSYVNGLIDSYAVEKYNRVALISFASSANLEAVFTELTETNVSSLHTSVNGITSSETTMADWSAGMSMAEGLLPLDRSSKLVVVFITGSNPSNTNGTKENAHNTTVSGNAITSAEELRSAGATVYTVWVGDSPAENTANALSSIGPSL